MRCVSKSEVYSWRMKRELKADLEAAARAEKATISGLLERIVREWLGGGGRVHDEEGQQRLHDAAAECFGRLKGGDALLSEEASSRVKVLLEKQHERHGSD